MTRRVAVIGSGVSGLVAAHLLSKRGSEPTRVTLYEADARLGGHADTHQVTAPDGETLSIDTGFIVHNERTYPTLLAIFAELGVPTQTSDMSMSVVDQRTGLEYAGALGARGLFPGGANLTRPRYLRMLTEITRFHRRARRLLAEPESPAGGEGDQTLAQFLEAGHFSAYFSEHFMTPLVACVWSCDPEVALAYPARYLFAFLEHHGMLTVFGSPTWRTVTGGSRDYVDRIAAGIPDVRLGCKVTEVRESDAGVVVTGSDGASTTYDAVVVATHPDQALALLAEPTALQREVLAAMPYSDNIAQLHTDTSVLPHHHDARASWNYQRRVEDDGRVLVTYDLTRLMRLRGWDDPDSAFPRYLVTLNGTDLVDPDTVIATREYAHPLYDPTSVAAQSRLPEIATDRIAFAGAYHGWGFHEDGALSGRRAAEHLGATWPHDDPAHAQQPGQSERTLAPTPRIYDTTIAHARTEPVRNAFRYRSYSWLVDLDAVPRFRGALGALARFEARDHVGDPARSIRANIDALLADHDVDLAGGPILMLAQARVLGYVFNPITVYWCHTPDRQLACVVVEVHNTYGGRHAYVVHPDASGRAQVGKELYVSPFNDTSGGYDLRVPEPGESVAISVTLQRPDRPPFVATLRGSVRPAGTGSLLRAAMRMPLAPLVASIRIRVQGIKLWARHVPVQPRPVQPRPDPPPPVPTPSVQTRPTPESEETR